MEAKILNQTKFCKAGLADSPMWLVVAANNATGEYRVLGSLYQDPQDMPEPEHPTTPNHQPVMVVKGEDPGFGPATAHTPTYGYELPCTDAARAMVQSHPALPPVDYCYGDWQLELYASHGWFTKPQDPQDM